MNKLKFLTLTIIFVMVAIFVAPRLMNVQAAPPDNDDFYNATVVSNLPFSDTIDTTEVTVEMIDGADPWPCNYYPNNSVWYTFTPSFSGPVQISTTGSNYNAVVGIFTGDYNLLNQVNCYVGNGPFVTSLSAGTIYSILVIDGGDPYTPPGGGILHLEISQPGGPVNDNFSTAKIIDTMPYEDTVDITFATVESNEPYSDCLEFGTPYNTIWYAYTPENDGILSGNISSDFDNFIAIYTGSSFDSLVELTCDNYNGGFQEEVISGTTYYFQLGSINLLSNGNISLSLGFIQAPSNDTFVDARIINTLPYEDSVDNTLATIEPEEPLPTCVNSNNRTIWYTYTPTDKGFLSGYSDTGHPRYLGVYTGNSLNDLVQVACEAGDSVFHIPVTPNLKYYIQIGSFFDWKYGYSTFHMYFNPSPPNDEFADATVVDSIPFYASEDNTFASIETNEPHPGCFVDPVDLTIWYKYKAHENGFIKVEKNGFHYSFMAVYTGSEMSNLATIRCASYYDYSRFIIPVEQGETYYFQIGSMGQGYNGSLTFSLSVPSLPNSDFWWFPGDPNRFDMVLFCDSSSDPENESLSLYWWNFGDGTQLETSDSCVTHQYPTDGDYTVWHQVQTSDGRSADITLTIPVRTHDVLISKFIVPPMGKVGQTLPVIVGVRNLYYPEIVTVRLYKSTPDGYEFVGELSHQLPNRGDKRQNLFIFTYEYTSSDASQGTIEFLAKTYLQDARDAHPEDNKAISSPVKVSN